MPSTRELPARRFSSSMRAGGFAGALMPRYGSSIRSPDGSSMIPKRSIGRSSRSRRKRSRPRRCRHRRDRSNRDHQSARDVRGVGAAQRTACLSRDRLAMPPQRRLSATRFREREPEVARAHGTARRSLFLRHQAEMAARRETRTARARRARRAVLRHDRHLAGVQTIARRGVRDRLHQRVAHDDVQPGAPRMGRRDARDARRSARDAAARGQFARSAGRDGAGNDRAARDSNRGE